MNKSEMIPRMGIFRFFFFFFYLYYVPEFFKDPHVRYFLKAEEIEVSSISVIDLSRWIGAFALYEENLKAI